MVPGDALNSPKPGHGLHNDTPAMSWDEALPLGNGLMGALVWGNGSPLNISLDRTDLWDMRPVPEFQTDEYNYKTMRAWVEAGREEDLERLYRSTYLRNPAPTKLPAGRIVLPLDERAVFEKAKLPLADAMAEVSFVGGMKLKALVHATERIGLIAIDNVPESFTPQLRAPPFGNGAYADQYGKDAVESQISLTKLGYPSPEKASGKDWNGYTQECWGGFRYAVAVVWKQRMNRWEGAWSIATSDEDKDVLGCARERACQAVKAGFDGMLASHRAWWTEFWKCSSIRLPNQTIERQWYLETYKFGAGSSRRGAPPMALQSPWTCDDGQIPPWKGDYHHDLNTELTYWPGYSANHLEEGLNFLDWLWKTKPHCEAWTKRFYGLPGLNVPGVADINNNPLGGGSPFSHSSTTGAWLAHHFYLHWRHSMDREFLRERAWPWLRDCATFIAAITEAGPDGKRTLRLSSSPEINEHTPRAWFSTITNYDLALIRWLLGATAELADELELKNDAARWRAILNEMPELAKAKDDERLLVAKDFALSDQRSESFQDSSSHRHLSHLMAIYPLGLVRFENGPDDRRIIRASLDELERLGTDAWCGYSFAWLVNLSARARDGEKAARATEIFATAFCLPNSFHCNGDQSGKGYSKFTYRPFTLEGNFACAAGIQEMLLQSHGGAITVFPAIPDKWKDVAFDTLRAEGAFLVSARRADGRTHSVTIVSEKGGIARLVDPFSGPASINVQEVADQRHEGDQYVFVCEPGARIEMKG